MTVAEELFQRTLSNLDKDIRCFVHDYENLVKYIDFCQKEAEKNQSDNPVLTSEYHFLSSFACFCYLIDNNVDTHILNKGKSLIEKACDIIPDDREYNLYRLMFSAFDVENVGSIDAFDILQKLNNECPSFRLLKNNLINADFAEDRFYDLLSKYLPEILDQLVVDNQPERCKDACQIMLNLPSAKYKLKAYTYLSRFLFEEGNFDEALRCAKLGVELLGSNVAYDFKDETCILWGECWTRVAECNRINKEYDFAMSLFEKGESLGIVACIHNLGVMYDNGESEDINHEKAKEYYAKAQGLKLERDAVLKAEKEKAEREEFERQEVLRIEIEKKEQEEALRILKLKNKKAKGIAWTIVVVLTSAIIALIVFLCSSTIEDRLYDYEKQGKAILAFENSANAPQIIFMDKSYVYVDRNNKVNKVLSVGKPQEYYEVSVDGTPNGTNVSLNISDNPFYITTSKKCYITPIPNKNAFLLSLSSCQSSNYGSSLKDCYLVSYSGENRSIGKIENGIIHDNKIVVKIIGDYTSYLKKYYPSSFSTSEISQLKKYSQYEADVALTLKGKGSFEASLDKDINFPKLYSTVPSQNLGNKENLNWFINDATTLLAGRLTSALVSKIFNTPGKLDFHDSNDGTKTFVIKRDGDDEENIYGLFVIDNATQKYRCIEHGERITFQQSCIHIAKHKSVLLIFSKTKDIYFDYNGYRQY